MPELPEVETLTRALALRLVGQRIEQVALIWPGSVAAPAPALFQAALAGRVVAAVARRGKFLLWRLDDGHWLAVHLRMTGRLLWREAGEGPDDHVRLVFHLSAGRELRFSDTRKFGRMWLVDDPSQVLGLLGPEPLDEGLSATTLRQRLRGRHAAIKAALLDQHLLAGVGNIYADEALFRAAIHPARPAGALTLAEVRTLLAALRGVLTEAISDRGTSSDSFRGLYGEKGSHQDRLAVYGRTGQSCVRCEAPVERMVVAQRGTHFCPRCQRRGRARRADRAR